MNVDDASDLNTDLFGYIGSDIFKTQISAMTVDLSVGDVIDITTPVVVELTTVGFGTGSSGPIS